LGGLSGSAPEHAKQVVRAAVAISDFMQRRQSEPGEKTFGLRAGVNSGPVVAGVVGLRKFAYDIWGDTVSTAARMEQSSQPGKINVSGTTYELIKDEFTCINRGKTGAKTKGEIDMYFVG
jgi:adenylate cyclase